MRISITKKIFLSYFILSIVPLIFLDTYFYYKSKEALINRTFDQLTTVRIEKETRLQNFFTDCFRDISFLSEIFNNNNTDSIFNIKKEVFNYLLDKEIYNKIIFASPNKQIKYFSKNGKQNIFKNKTPEYNAIKEICDTINIKNKPVVFDRKNYYTKNTHSILLVYKKYDKNNKYIGSIIAEISFNAINKIMFENNPHNGLGKTGETYIVSDDYYMRSSSRFKDNSIFKIKVETKAVKEALSGITGNKQISDYRNIPVLSSYNKLNIKELNWVVLAEIDLKEAMIPIYSIRNNILYMSIILAILLLGLVEIMVSKLSSPIKKLKFVTDDVSKGKYTTCNTVKNNDEIGDLVTAFNKMIKQLEYQSDKLKKERLLRTESLLNGQEIERQRLSRELHDSIGQSILAIKMKFEKIKEAPLTEQKKLIEETEKLFNKTLTEIRNISNNLMPAVLTQFGLISAIKKFIREYKENTNIEVNFIESLEQTTKLNKNIEIHIFRIIQETFNNILKYADATEITLILDKKNNYLELIIEDNGKGFEVNKEIFSKGNGLSNIKERINLLNGKVNIKSEKNKGTSIYCKIPLKNETN